jgi:hypothetical protein
MSKSAPFKNDNAIPLQTIGITRFPCSPWDIDVSKRYTAFFESHQYSTQLVSTDFAQMKLKLEATSSEVESPVTPIMTMQTPNVPGHYSISALEQFVMHYLSLLVSQRFRSHNIVSNTPEWQGAPIPAETQSQNKFIAPARPQTP